jgi:hypothetical protein
MIDFSLLHCEDAKAQGKRPDPKNEILFATLRLRDFAFKTGAIR